MLTLEQLRILWDYEFWAKQHLMEHFRHLSQEDYTRNLGVRFESVQGTLGHLVAVQMIWLARWKGMSPRAMVQPSGFSTPSALEERWNAVEFDLRAHLRGLSDADLGRPITYRNTVGRTFTDPLWLLMHHVLHHTTFYRGEATALLRMLGVNARIETESDRVLEGASQTGVARHGLGGGNAPPRP